MKLHKKSLLAIIALIGISALLIWAFLRGRKELAMEQVEKATASLDASRREYERLKPLHENNRNISDKTFQAAEAAWRSNEADAHAAQEALHTINAAVRQRWGSVVARWLVEKSPVFNRLRQQQDVLIQTTLPPDTHLASAPQTAMVQTADSKLVSAKLVSLSPHTAPRIQGMGFFYVASIQPGLLPGMNVIVYLQTGPRYQGVVVPDPAVVWRQGKAWVYVQKGTGQFVRREISTETPVKDGWFVLKGTTASDRIVVKGLQLLMSEESRSQIQVGD